MDVVQILIWIGVAVVMAVLEMTTVQLVSVWFVLGALCAAVTGLFTDSVPIQLAVFVCVSLLALLITRPLVAKFKRNNVKVNTNADRMIGKTGEMQTDLIDAEAIGQAKVLGGVWTVKTDNPPLQKGDKVRVLAIEGVKLIVEKAD